MDVRPGYKLTEVGCIPDEWSVAIPSSGHLNAEIHRSARNDSKCVYGEHSSIHDPRDVTKSNASRPVSTNADQRPELAS